MTTSSLNQSLRRKPKTLDSDTSDALIKCTRKHKTALKKDRFDKAEELHNKKLHLLEKHRNEEIRHEEQRQYSEKKNLHIALNQMKTQNNAHWDNQWNKFLHWREEKLSELDQKHSSEIERFDSETVPQIQSQPVRYSTQVQDDLRAKERLKLMHKYSECEILTKKLAARMQQEESTFKFQQRLTVDKRRARLLQKHDKEKSFLLQKLKILEAKLLQQKDRDVLTLERKFSNLLADAEHAFRMEFVAQREVEGPVVSRKSLEKTSATYLGSLLQKKLREGQQYVVPSLIEQFGDELDK